MRGASRQALTEARERLEVELGSADGATTRAVSADLLSVTRLLGREIALARALSDPGTESDARVGLVDSLFAGQVGDIALRVLRDSVALRWSAAGNFVNAVELLGVQAALTASAAAGDLDDVEDELFRFARIVERSPGLTSALADPSVPAHEKSALVDGLLATKANPVTIDLVAHLVASLRGRAPVRVLDELAAEAAAHRNRRIAVARVAVPLDEATRLRLESAVGRAVGHDVRLQIELDPGLVGGIVVQVGDEVLDGSVARRMAQVTRALTP